MECSDEDDLKRLSREWSGKPLLLLGPGKNMELQRDRIDRYIKENAPVVIAVNYIPENIPVDYAFLSNSRRYVQLTTRLLELKKGAGARPGVPGPRHCHFQCDQCKRIL